MSIIQPNRGSVNIFSDTLREKTAIFSYKDFTFVSRSPRLHSGVRAGILYYSCNAPAGDGFYTRSRLISERIGDAQMKRLCLMLLLAALIFCVPALAEDVCPISGSALSSGVTTDCSYVNINCPVTAPAQVQVSIYAPNGSLAWQCNYGEKGSSFTTDDIYLKLQGSSTVYQAVVSVGSTVYSFPITRTMARLSGNAACTAGYPLRAITGSDTWQSATILHVSAMEGQKISVPIYASSAYTLGTATMTVHNGALTVSLTLANGLDGSIDGAEIRIATDALTAQQLDSKRFGGITGRADTPIPLGNADYAAVYVRMSVSFNPSTAAVGIQTQPSPDQTGLWQQMESSTANEAIG